MYCENSWKIHFKTHWKSWFCFVWKNKKYNKLSGVCLNMYLKCQCCRCITENQGLMIKLDFCQIPNCLLKCLLLQWEEVNWKLHQNYLEYLFKLDVFCSEQIRGQWSTTVESIVPDKGIKVVTSCCLAAFFSVFSDTTASSHSIKTLPCAVGVMVHDVHLSDWQVTCPVSVSSGTISSIWPFTL